VTTQSAREAKQDIAEVLIRYATGIDRRDWDLFRTCFADRCHLVYPGIGTWDTCHAITDFMMTAHAQLGHTMHRISNIAIAVEGETAEARCYVDAVLLGADGQSGFNPIGWYDDQLVHDRDGWRITQRIFTMAHFRTIEAGGRSGGPIDEEDMR
jgi:3-phenylpropionate/cinnamic acid dioxygenase small subunit